MGYRVNPDGSIDAATATEALELSELVRARNAAKSRGPAADAKSGNGAAKQTLSAEAAQAIAAEFSDWVVPSAIKFLTTIQQSPPSGANGQQIMQAMGITDSKAFGGRSAAINKLIDSVGFSVSQVYDASKGSQGRFWRGKAKLPEVLSIIKTIAAQQL